MQIGVIGARNIGATLMQKLLVIEREARSGTRAANRFVRSAQSGPLVARIAISRFRSAMAANPSGTSTLRTVTWKFTGPPVSGFRELTSSTS